MLDRIANLTYKAFLTYPDKIERLVYLLLFLFPIAGMSVKHWITNIFNILVLIGLFVLRKKRTLLLKEEKLLLWICAAYFSMFILSSFGNGWTELQTRYLGTEIRFLLVIPLYLLVRQYKDSSKWFLMGFIVAGFFLFAQSYYEVVLIYRKWAEGVYSKNILGPMSVLVVFFGLYSLLFNIHVCGWLAKFVIILSILAALYALAVSSSRGAYVGFIITAMCFLLFSSKFRWGFLGAIIFAITLAISYKSIDQVRNGTDQAIGNAVKYFRVEDPAKDYISITSAGAHLEMIRTGIFLIRDNPIIGIGPGNYNKEIAKYIKEGKATPDLVNHAFPHNSYIEAATAKGLIGLMTLLLLLFYPAAIYIRDYKRYRQTSVIGLIHIVAMSSFAFFDHSVIVMNNYTSILLLGIALFFSSHLNACRAHEMENG